MLQMPSPLPYAGDMARRRTLTVTDPAVLKALAHPVRQRLLNLLSADDVVTATDAAQSVGMTPSAVSHHLRQLEKYGLVVRVDPAGDARERPWRMTAATINLDPGSLDVAGRAALDVIVGNQVVELSQRIERHLDADRNAASPGWGPYTGLARTDLWLTEEEVAQLQTDLQGLLDGLRKRRTTRRRRTDGSRRHTFVHSLLPDPGP